MDDHESLEEIDGRTLEERADELTVILLRTIAAIGGSPLVPAIIADAGEHAG